MGSATTFTVASSESHGHADVLFTTDAWRFVDTTLKGATSDAATNAERHTSTTVKPDAPANADFDGAAYASFDVSAAGHFDASTTLGSTATTIDAPSAAPFAANNAAAAYTATVSISSDGFGLRRPTALRTWATLAATSKILSIHVNRATDAWSPDGVAPATSIRFILPILAY